MKRAISIFLSMAALALGNGATAAEVKFEDSFADGLAKWHLPASRAEVGLSDIAATGGKSAEIRFDPAGQPENRYGGVISSPDIPLGKGIYRITGQIQLAEGYGSSVVLEFFDASNRKLGDNGYHFGSAPPSVDTWLKVDFTGSAYQEEVSHARITLYIPYRVKQIIRLDGFRVEALPVDPIPPPWEPQYKIRPQETARLTPADFPGPDGIVYPDFTYAGARAAVLKRANPKRIRLRVKEGDDLYQSLRDAIDSLPENGGTVEIPAGHFVMSRMLGITRDFVTVKGAGSDRTRVDFVYDPGENRVDLYGLKTGDRIAPKQAIHLYARPAELQTLILEVDGREFGRFTRSLHSGNQSMFVKALPDDVAPGKHTLRGTALYRDGGHFTVETEVMVDPAVKPTLPHSEPRGFISFRGKGFSSRDFRLAADGVRGSSTVTLQDKNHPFKAGDIVILRALETPERRKVNKNACNWGSFRSTHLFIDKVDGPRLTFNQPLRLDYPVADLSFVRKFNIVQGGRIEGMTLETKFDFWLTTVSFEYASDCVARDLKVIRCGRNPVYGSHVKFCSILDCEFDGSWYNGGGGTAYVGWDSCSDCLTDGIVTRGMRHAPVVQWGASGNVIRNGTFYHCDAHWHAGWSNENLFENCVIISDTKEFGGYGNIFLSTGPDDGAHGPNGPRNVVYRCDGYGIADGVHCGGMNENWIFVYNRFRVKQGRGFFLRSSSFDHIIQGNVVILEDNKSPFVLFATPDCSGVELIGNTFSGGNGQVHAGLLEPLLSRDNRVIPLDPDLPRPTPAVPSIYEWQLQQKRGRTAL